MTGRSVPQPGRFSIATLGCKVNQFESAAIIEQLAAAGWRQVPFGQDADLCLINSCTVTARSDAETRRLIRRARRAAPAAWLVASGCCAQVAPETLMAMAEVDQVLGNEEKLELIRHLQHRQHRVAPCRSAGQQPPAARLTCFADHTRAFLQVQNGCDAGCSYCIVPAARGASRSAHPDQVLQTAARLAAAGHQELVLTGIHLGSYGSDLQPRTGLLQLVQQLEAQGAFPRIRLGSLEPNELHDELLALFAASPRLCPHLHVPLQSGSDSVLKRMGRTYDTACYRERIETVSRLLPEAFIAADLIAGFPGESDEEHRTTCEFVSSLSLADLHVFPYSARPGTPAAALPGHLPAAVIRQRAEELRSIAAAKLAAFRLRFVGSILPVLGMRYNRQERMIHGLSRNYLEVVFPGSEELLNREVVVEIVSERAGRLVGSRASF